MSLKIRWTILLRGSWHVRFPFHFLLIFYLQDPASLLSPMTSKPRLGLNTQLSDAPKDCQISLDLHYPPRLPVLSSLDHLLWLCRPWCKSDWPPVCSLLLLWPYIFTYLPNFSLLISPSKLQLCHNLNHVQRSADLELLDRIRDCLPLHHLVSIRY